MYGAPGTQALLGAARNGKVTLPPEAGPYRSGQSKKYFTHDLLAAWQGFLDERVDLPPLLAEYRAGAGPTERPGGAGWLARSSSSPA